MTFYGVNVLFSLKQILSLILKHSRCTAVNKGRKSLSFHNSNALYQWSEAFAKTQSLFKYNSSLFSIIAILGDLPIALRRQKVVLPSQNDGFWLAQKLSCKHDSTALKWVRRAQIKILLLWMNMRRWMVLFITFHLSLQSFWHCSRTTYNVFFVVNMYHGTADTTFFLKVSEKEWL